MTASWATTARSRRDRSRWWRCRGTATRRSGRWPICARRSVPATPTSCGIGPIRLATRSTTRSGWTTSTATRWRSTARRSRCGRSPRTPDICCGRRPRNRTGCRDCAGASWRRTCSVDTASARSARTTRRTTRSATTEGRCGPTRRPDARPRRRGPRGGSVPAAPPSRAPSADPGGAPTPAERPTAVRARGTAPRGP